MHESFQARPGDVATIKSIVRANYEVISGLRTDTRDWARLKSLYTPDARLIPIERREDGATLPRVMSTDGFIESRGPFFLREDFFEWETDRREENFGAMAQVWSSYDAGRTPGGDITRSGVNSIQLWHDGARWWIVTVMWDGAAALVSESFSHLK